MRIRLACRRSRVRSSGPATFFRGDWSWNHFYDHSLPTADSSRAVVSYWRKDVHLVPYWLTAYRKPAQEQCAVVRLTDHLDMTIVVDWDVKPQIKQININIILWNWGRLQRKSHFSDSSGWLFSPIGKLTNHTRSLFSNEAKFKRDFTLKKFLFSNWHFMICFCGVILTLLLVNLILVWAIHIYLIFTEKIIITWKLLCSSWNC